MGPLEKYLTAAGYLVALTGVAMATSAPVALGGSLAALTSLNKLHENLTARVPDLNRRVAGSLADALAQTTGLPRDADLLIPQMIEFGALTPAEVMTAGRTAEGVCAAMLAKLSDREHLRTEMKAAFSTVIQPILADLLNDTQVGETLRPAFETAAMQTLAAIEAQTDKLVEASERNARQCYVQEGQLIALARRYAEGDLDDFDSAYRGLERALQTSTAMRTAPTSDVGEAVNRTIAHVNELNAVGQIKAAGIELRKIIAEQTQKETEAKAAMITLLRQGVNQAILERSVSDAANLSIQLLDYADDPPSQLQRFKLAHDEWFIRGRDHGLNFDLEVAIALANEATFRATSPEALINIQDSLGLSLRTLGERTGDTTRLKQAVSVHRAASKCCHIKRDPTDRAMSQNSLGNALAILGKHEILSGEVESGTAHIHEAIELFHSALTEFPRDKTPGARSLVQINLGATLQYLTMESPDVPTLKEAVGALKAALEVQDRLSDPIQWAMIKNNLGNALRRLGATEKGTKTLESSDALQDALEEWTLERVPLYWAAAHLNLSVVEWLIAERLNISDATKSLDRALSFCQAALEVYTPEETPHYYSDATKLLDYLQSACASLDAGVWPPAP